MNEDEGTGTSRSDLETEAPRDEGEGTSGSKAAKLFEVKSNFICHIHSRC